MCGYNDMSFPGPKRSRSHCTPNGAWGELQCGRVLVSLSVVCVPAQDA